MKILNTVMLLVVLISCENKQQQTTATDIKDSSNISPSIGGPVAEIKETVRIKDTVPTGRKTLMLRDVQAQLLDSSTKIGKPNDLLLTISGQGFIFTEHNPSVVIGDKKFSDSYSNEDGSELYVIIPAAEVQRFAATLRDSLKIINPGNQAASIKQDGKEIISKASKAGKTGLIFTTYGVTRKRAG